MEWALNPDMGQSGKILDVQGPTDSMILSPSRSMEVLAWSEVLVCFTLVG